MYVFFSLCVCVRAFVLCICVCVHLCCAFVCVLCVQVVAALFSNTALVLEMLSKTTFPSTNDSIITQFISTWLQECQKFEGWVALHDSLHRFVTNSAVLWLFCNNSIHDRKMSVLGLCCLLQSQNRPAVVQSNAAVIVPLIIHQLDLLVAAYRS